MHEAGSIIPRSERLTVSLPDMKKLWGTLMVEMK